MIETRGRLRRSGPELLAEDAALYRWLVQRVLTTHSMPTLREIADEFGFASTWGAQGRFSVLIEQGLLRRVKFKSRTLELVGVRLSVTCDRSPAGRQARELLRGSL